MKIVPKNKKCVVEMIEEDEDLINLVDGDTYFRVWRDGEFEVDQVVNTTRKFTVNVSDINEKFGSVTKFKELIKTDLDFLIEFGEVINNIENQDETQTIRICS